MTTIHTTPELTATPVPAFPAFSPQLVATATTVSAQNCMNHADDVLALVLSLGFHHAIEAVAPVEWGASHHLIESGQNMNAPHLKLFGYFLGVVAIQRSGVGGLLIDKLRTQLLALVLPWVAEELAAEAALAT
jgi:hypothetical protein